jgi:hypothetical protein
MKLDAIYDDFSAERKAAEPTFLIVGFVMINDEFVKLTKNRYYQIKEVNQ